MALARGEQALALQDAAKFVEADEVLKAAINNYKTLISADPKNAAQYKTDLDDTVKTRQVIAICIEQPAACIEDTP